MQIDSKVLGELAVSTWDKFMCTSKNRCFSSEQRLTEELLHQYIFFPSKAHWSEVITDKWHDKTLKWPLNEDLGQN